MQIWIVEAGLSILIPKNESGDSGSLDPLGFARGYLALADRLLPSFTTVTTVPRYVSMLCAALKAVQTHFRHESGMASSKVRQERLKLVKAYERAWALACGLAARDGTSGAEAVGGLRGKRVLLKSPVSPNPCPVAITEAFAVVKVGKTA